MHAFRLVSIYIFNGMSKLAHRQRSMAGQPFRIPYPSAQAKRAVQLASSGRQKERHSQQLAIGDTEEAPDDYKSRAAGDAEDEVQYTSPRRRKFSSSKEITAESAATKALLLDEYKLRMFMYQLEDETLKLLEPTEQGIKVPRPVPYPSYLWRNPDIPISHTYTTVLRRLHNEEKSKVLKSEFEKRGKKYPKKPHVPIYKVSDIVEHKEKTVKVLLKSQLDEGDSEVENQHNLVMLRKRTKRKSSNTDSKSKKVRKL